jgi:hypothetical protein
MAMNQNRRKARKTPVPVSRSMPSTKGAQPTGAHSYADTTIRRSRKMAAPAAPMIAPSKKGAFSAKAKAAGMTPLAYANQVLANTSKYPTETVQQANFAKNFGGASKRNAQKGGGK